MASSFSIPSSLQDLERSPLNLLPYPENFDDSNEASRADSFQSLVQQVLQQGNRCLQNIAVFYNEEEVWLDEERLQALYTLVRYVIETEKVSR